MVGEFRSVYPTVFFTSRKIPLTDVQSPSLALLAGKLEALPPDLRYQAEPGNTDPEEDPPIFLLEERGSDSGHR